MDSLTHIALGATIGEVVLGKKIGNKAIFYGAIIGSIPDLDVIITPLIEPTKALLFHRGISHSILIALLLVPLIAYTLSKIIKIKDISLKEWITFTALTYSSHIFIDCFNTYGTGIFEPFSSYRFAYDSMAIIDIFFLLPLLSFTIVILFISYKRIIRRVFASIGLSIATFVLVFSIINKEYITQKATTHLKSQGINFSRILTTPAPLTNFYWATVAETEDGYYIGFINFFNDTKLANQRFIPKNKELLKEVEENEQIKNIMRFSKGFYSVEKDSVGNLWMHDLRYVGLDFDNNQSYVFSFGIKENNGKVEVTRAHPNRKINLNTIREYFELVF